MKKRLFSLLCALLLLVAAMPSALALTGEEARAADTLATLGLVQGTANGYALSQPATRAQAVVMTLRLAGAQQAVLSDNWISGFRDVPAWVEAEINYAAHQGLVTGLTPYTFGPNETVTANAFCAFLLRMLGYSDKEGDFTAADAAVFSQHIGLLSQPYSGGLTRSDLFTIADEALVFRYKGSEERVIDRLISSGSVNRATANALGLLTQPLTARQAGDRLSAAVFGISTYETQAEIAANAPSASASGFFITADGLAVTNYHSISGAIRAEATLSTGQKYPVEKVIYSDAAIDIAVLQISKTSLEHKAVSAFAHLEMASASTLRSGDVVYALGNPLGLGLSLSAGVISATGRTVERYQLPCIVSTADISQGSSGGALLNIYGQVVGVTSGAYLYGNSMYLAVPIDPAQAADLTAPGKTLPELAKQAK